MPHLAFVRPGIKKVELLDLGPTYLAGLKVIQTTLTASMLVAAGKFTVFCKAKSKSMSHFDLGSRQISSAIFEIKCEDLN